MAEKIPNHIAIIMDGNNRWARLNKVSAQIAYDKGADALDRLINSCLSLNIKYLTIYAFSLENRRREASEVAMIMSLAKSYASKNLSYFQEKNIRFNIIGEEKNIDEEIINVFNEVKELTCNNDGLYLNIAFNYGGRQEILRAIKLIIEDCRLNNTKLTEIDENYFSDYLYTHNMPDPDLLIRTSGEVRLSNFLLWQLSYTELYFTETLWPDFDHQELMKSIENFSKRERRYGRTSG